VVGIRLAVASTWAENYNCVGDLSTSYATFGHFMRKIVTNVQYVSKLVDFQNASFTSINLRTVLSPIWIFANVTPQGYQRYRLQIRFQRRYKLWPTWLFYPWHSFLMRILAGDEATDPWTLLANCWNTAKC